MKTYYGLLLATVFLVSCGQSSKNKVDATDSQEAALATGEKLTVDVAQSKIHWTGYKPGGSHHGTLSLQSGELYLEGTELKSGTFVLDMNSIVNEDLTDEKSNAQLVGHLKSADFFDVEKYPTGQFEITQVSELSRGTDSLTIRISGNLELKGISKNISFNATVRKDGDNTYKAVTPVFTIDRTQWGVNYGSKNIFKDLKDKFINDDMDIRMEIVAHQ